MPTRLSCKQIRTKIIQSKSAFLGNPDSPQISTPIATPISNENHANNNSFPKVLSLQFDESIFLC